MSSRVSITAICAAIVHFVAGACNSTAPPELRAAWQARVEGVFDTHCPNGAEPTVRCANGCTYTWSATQADAPEGIVVTCPPKSNPPWSDPPWSPVCEADRPSGLADPTGNGTCWAPPTHWCYDAAELTETAACDPNSDRCCGFPSDCIPCGWEVCHFGSAGASSARCEAAAGKNTCPDDLYKMVTSCEICGGVTVCPP